MGISRSHSMLDQISGRKGEGPAASSKIIRELISRVRSGGRLLPSEVFADCGEGEVLAAVSEEGLFEGDA